MNAIDTLIGALDIESKKLPHLSQNLEGIRRKEEDIDQRSPLERRVLSILLEEEKGELSKRYLQIFAFVKLALEKIPEKTDSSDLARLKAKVITILIPVKQALGILNPTLSNLLSNGQSR